MPKNEKSLATIIKEARENIGISQRELARQIGVGNNTIARLENGERKTTNALTLRKISSALHLDYLELLKMAGFSEQDISFAMQDNSNIVTKLRELRKKFSEYGNYSGNKIKEFQDAFYIEFGKFIETSKCKGSEQNKIKEGGININKYVEKIEEFLPKLLEFFEVKDLLVFGDIIVSELREFIDEFDETKPEQSYHRLMELKNKLKDFKLKEGIDEEYWYALKKCISDYMVGPIAYGIQDLIKKKLDNNENFKKLYANNNSLDFDYAKFKKSYQKGNRQKIDEQIKKDKKLKENARRDENREKIDKQIEADKESAKNNGIINKLLNFFGK